MGTHHIEKFVAIPPTDPDDIAKVHKIFGQFLNFNC